MVAPVKRVHSALKQSYPFRTGEINSGAENTPAYNPRCDSCSDFDTTSRREEEEYNGIRQVNQETSGYQNSACDESHRLLTIGCDLKKGEKSLTKGSLFF
jgi:hypothetical protein